MIGNLFAIDVTFHVIEFTEFAASFKLGQCGRSVLQNIFFYKASSPPGLQYSCVILHCHFKTPICPC